MENMDPDLFLQHRRIYRADVYSIYVSPLWHRYMPPTIWTFWQSPVQGTWREDEKVRGDTRV